MRSIPIFTPLLLASLLAGCSASSGVSSQSEPSVGSGGAGSSGDVATGGAWTGSAGTSNSGGSAGMPAAAGAPGAAGQSGGGSGGTTAASGACTNASDQTILGASDVSGAVGNCAQQNLGAEPGTRNCIQQTTGLSGPCVDCFDGEVQCATQNCMSQCMFNPNGPDCINCRKQFCDPAFATCSGLTP